MKHFIIRYSQDNQEVQIFNNSIYYKSDIELFKQFEPSFNLAINIKQLEYYQNSFLEKIHFNGTVETELGNWEEGNNYINNISSYIDLKAKYETDLLVVNQPQTLEKAKEKLIEKVYRYASIKINAFSQEYSSLERDNWMTLLAESKAFLISQNTSDAPNLLTIEQLRHPSSSPSAIKQFLNERANTIVNKHTELLTNVNTVIGMRGFWYDRIQEFQQTNMETEQEAIQRLLALDWKTNW